MRIESFIPLMEGRKSKLDDFTGAFTQERKLLKFVGCQLPTGYGETFKHYARLYVPPPSVRWADEEREGGHKFTIEISSLGAGRVIYDALSAEWREWDSPQRTFLGRTLFECAAELEKLLGLEGERTFGWMSREWIWPTQEIPMSRRVGEVALLVRTLAQEREEQRVREVAEVRPILDTLKALPLRFRVAFALSLGIVMFATIGLVGIMSVPLLHWSTFLLLGIAGLCLAIEVLLAARGKASGIDGKVRSKT